MPDEEWYKEQELAIIATCDRNRSALESLRQSIMAVGDYHQKNRVNDSDHTLWLACRHWATWAMDISRDLERLESGCPNYVPF